MKLTTILLLITTLQIFATDAYSQYTELTLNLGETNVGQVLAEIENQSEFYFLFNQKLVDTERRVNVQVSEKKIGEVLDLVFAETNTDYVVMDRQIVLSPREYLAEVKASLQPGPAQPATITGRVTDPDGEPLPGVSIVIKGTTRGTITNLNGDFSIDTDDPEAVLIFLYLGYATQEIPASGQSTIDVVMEEDAIGLDEVVVTALGIEKEKKQITYSAQNVEAENIAQARELNVANSLAGKVAGLEVTKAASGVGSATRVMLRGNRSIVGNNQPLYIVDGVPISNFTYEDVKRNQIQEGDGIGNINPDDIESVTVLKGPNATALYGARASNGAVVLTTKKGAARKGIGVEFSTNSSIDKAMPLTNYQYIYGQGNGGTYFPTSEEGWGAKMEGQMVDHWSPDPEWAGKQYAYSAHRPFEEFFQTGYNLANTLTLTTGTQKVRTLLSYTNTNAEGIIETNKLKRNNVNLRIDGQLSKRLSFDAKLTYFNQSVHNRVPSGDFDNVMKAIYRHPTNISLEESSRFEFFDAVGNRRQNYWNTNTLGGQNPYWLIHRSLNDEMRNRMIGMGSLRYQFTDNLSLMVRSSFDQISDNQTIKQYNNSYKIADFGELILVNRYSLEMNHDFLLNYHNIWGDGTLSLNASVGGNMLYQNSDGLTTQTNRLLKPNLFVITNTGNIKANQTGAEKQVNSLFGFATVGFKDFLFLDVTARNDWSSTLPPENWSYFYPSVGLTWILSDMLENTPDFLTFAKLRASYAEVGNDTEPYQLDNTFGFWGGGALGMSYRGGILPQENLMPENTKSTELGFDVRFFQNRLGVDFTWYKSNTFNQLLSIPLPKASGYSAKFVNAGNIQNQGMELTLNATPVVLGDFSWDLVFNYARNENLCIELTDELTEYTTTANKSLIATFKVVEGEPFGQMYARGYNRNDEGRILINDLGLPDITPGKTLPIGNINPDWIGGLSNSFNYKGISLSALIDIRMGGDIISYTEANLTFDGWSESTLEGREGMVVDGVMLSDGSENTIEITAEEYWHSLGGRLTPVGEPYLLDASFVRLREVLLGYTWKFENSLFQSIGLSLYGRNLAFLYNAAGIIDPNTSLDVSNEQGVEGYALPSARTYGINARFKF